MQIGRFIVALVSILAVGLPSAVHAQGLAPAASTAVAERPIERADGSSSQPPANWRYRKFNGQWWYFLPNEQWARWNGRQWTIPAPNSSDYHQWRRQQFAGRFSDAAGQDEAMRRQELDRWRTNAGQQRSRSLGQSDTEYHAQVDRFQDRGLMITPYDYRIGTAGHGLFDANPDRTIANSGRMNYANSMGGYMGSALQSPYGY